MSICLECSNPVVRVDRDPAKKSIEFGKEFVGADGLVNSWLRICWRVSSECLIDARSRRMAIKYSSSQSLDSDDTMEGACDRNTSSSHSEGKYGRLEREEG